MLALTALLRAAHEGATCTSRCTCECVSEREKSKEEKKMQSGYTDGRTNKVEEKPVKKEKLVKAMDFSSLQLYRQVVAIMLAAEHYTRSTHTM